MTRPSLRPVVTDAVACTVRAVAMTFTPEKSYHEVPLDEVEDAIRNGAFVWIDVNFADAETARQRLAPLGLVSDDILDDALRGEPVTRQARYSECIHFALCDVDVSATELHLRRLDLVMGTTFLVTLHQGARRSLTRMSGEVFDDFREFAQSPSFLLYDIWDHLLDSYARALDALEARVEEVRKALATRVSQDLFVKVSELQTDLLHFRQVLLPVRGVLTDLSTRKSKFVSEATQHFLANMVSNVEHTLQELLVVSDILVESVNLSMTVVGFRTNEVMKRLTIVSVVFLPLTFLVGVYGMNFDNMPELHWGLGYAYFWLLVLVVIALVVIIMRRIQLL